MSHQTIVLCASMSGRDLADSIAAMRGGLKTYAHDVSIKNGEFVVHLRKPAVSEKLKMALMSKAMKQERLAVATSVIKELANKIGVNGDQLLAAIGSGRNREAREAIWEASIKVGIQSAAHEDLFG